MCTVPELSLCVAPSGYSSSKAPLRRILPKTDRSVCIPSEQCPEPADRQAAAHLIQMWGGEGNLKTLACGFGLKEGLKLSRLASSL